MQVLASICSAHDASKLLARVSCYPSLLCRLSAKLHVQSAKAQAKKYAFVLGGVMAMLDAAAARALAIHRARHVVGEEQQCQSQQRCTITVVRTGTHEVDGLERENLK